MKNEVDLGIAPSPSAQRDAIHVALAPVVAGEDLIPGERVGLMDGEAVGNAENKIGIADPFRTCPVKKGTRVWLLLFPETITGLRHDWEHPAFTSPSAEEAWETIDAIANRMGFSRHRLMDSAHGYAVSGDYEYDNSETPKDLDLDWEQFWSAWEVVTGRQAPEDAWAPFTCSC